MTNHRCGVNAASLCERGYSQPTQVLPLPVWDDASSQPSQVCHFIDRLGLSPLIYFSLEVV